MSAAPLAAPWSLAALLAPLSVERFCEQYWGRRPLRIERRQRGFYSELFDLARLERYLSIDEIFARHSITMPKQGYGMPDPPPASIAEIYRRFLQGDSLRLRQMESFMHPSEPLIALLREMVLGLQHPKESLSCYVAPPNAIGLGPHYDGTEIFTLQVSGAKRWRLYHRVDSDESAVCDPAQLGAPEHDFVLQQGDLLYLPRGFVHEVASEGASFSLTIVFAPFTFRVLLDELVEKLAHHSAFIESLPAGTLLQRRTPQAFADQLAVRIALVQKTLSELSADALREKLAAKLIAGMPLPQGAQLDTVLQLDHITLETRVERRPGTIGHLAVRDDTVVLTLPGGYKLEASARAEAALAHVLAREGEFGVSELAGGLSDRAKVTLARQLVLCGLLTVAAARPSVTTDPIELMHTPRLLPIGFDRATRRVELLQMDECELREPFFHESVAQARKQRPDALDLEVDLAAFSRATNRLTRDPDGVIFHVGRCGSTLLANMLTASGEHLLLKEPDIVSDLIAGALNTPDEATRVELERGLLGAVRWLVEHGGSARQRVLKLAAWNVRLGGVLLDGAPKLRALFMYRDPLQTVASMMFQQPAWFDLIDCPRELTARFFPTVAEQPGALTPIALFAHAWLSIVEAALALPAERCLLVEYEALVKEPLRTLTRVLAHLGQPQPPDVLARMVAASALYSKDASGRAAYDPQGSHHRPALAASERAEVERITSAAWSRLQARSRTLQPGEA